MKNKIDYIPYINGGLVSLREDLKHVRIAPKQYSKMCDYMAEWVSCPTDIESEDVLIQYQDEIGWPWKATHEQIKSWNRQFYDSWASCLLCYLEKK